MILFYLRVLNQMSFKHPPRFFKFPVSPVSFKGLAKYGTWLIAVIDLCPLSRY